MAQRRKREASGVIADLFSEHVGFYPGWGFSRTLRSLDRELITRRGNLDWRSAEALVCGICVRAMSLPPVSGRDLPPGLRKARAQLYHGVAVGQVHSGWTRAGGTRPGPKRLVALRYHFGKRRVRGAKLNAVCLQYRVWVRKGRGRGARVMSARRAGRLFEDLHRLVRDAIEGGER